MNPFTESTVARPLARAPRRLKLVVATPPCKRMRRSRVDTTLSTAAPVTSPGLAVAGTFASAAGLLATFFLPGLAFALDVNAATQEQLRGVRGIGPKTAQIIIEERSRGGRYESLEDLSDRVKGIGSKKASSLQAAGLSVGTGGASQAKPAGMPASTAGKPAVPGTSSSKPSGPPGARSVFRLPSQAK